MRRDGTLQHLLYAQLMFVLLLKDGGPQWLASDEPNVRKIIAAWRRSHNHGTWECQANGDTQGQCPTPYMFHYRLPLLMSRLASPGKAAGCGRSSSFWQLCHWPDGWPEKEHSPCQRVRQLPSFAKCCQTFLEMLPYLVAYSCTCSFLFSDFPTTSLCPSGHLTLEAGCNGNMFTSTINHILFKSKPSAIHMISVPSSTFAAFLPSSSHTALEHRPESPFH